MDEKKAKRIVESVFSFDYIGDEMGKVRTNLDDEDAQEAMFKALLGAATKKAGAAADPAALEKLCRERVQQFVTSAKSSRGTGCGS